MSARLEKQIEARKAEALQKGIRDKAASVAMALGRDRSNGPNERCHVFEDDNFIIEDVFGEISGSDGSMGYSGTTVRFKNEIVFDCGGGETHSFVPGPWEKLLNGLSKKAAIAARKKNKIAKKEQQTRAAQKDAGVRKKWGL